MKVRAGIKTISIMLVMLLVFTAVFNSPMQPSAAQGSQLVWNFNNNNDLENWNTFTNISTVKVEGGFLNLVTDNLDPYMLSKSDLNLDASVYNTFEIRMKNGCDASSAQIYWISDRLPVWGEDNLLNFTITGKDSQYTTYKVNLAQNKNWTSKILQIRVDPQSGASNGGPISIDYIKLYYSEENKKDAQGNEKNQSSESILSPNGEVVWSFNVDGDLQGWSGFNMMSDIKVSGGYLSAQTTGEDPYMYSSTPLDINTLVYDTLEIKMKNGTSADIGQIFWVSEESPGWSGTQKINFPIKPNDTEYSVYTVLLKENPEWAGTVTQIRIDPQQKGAGGPVSIDYIKLKNSAGKYEGLKVNTTIPASEIKGLDITDKRNLVSMLYFTSLNLMHTHKYNNGVRYNAREILEKNLKNPQWGPNLSTVFWDEPALGYYNPEDPAVVRQHMEWMADAGVDFIVIDNTNANDGWTIGKYLDDGATYYDVGVVRPQTVLLDTMLEMRKEGKKTPYVVFWSGTTVYGKNLPGAKDPNFVVLDTYRKFYKSGKYNELFVYWDGKPFHMVTGQVPDMKALEEYFTLRACWALKPNYGNKEWSAMEVTPQRYGRNGKEVEQVSVSVSYHENYQTYNGMPRSGGKIYQEQWERAFELKPKIVTLNYFNLWSSIMFESIIREGVYEFTDTYNREFSGDIEPMKGGHGDLYLQWTKIYSEALKKGEPCPQLALAEVDTWKGWYPKYNKTGAYGPLKGKVEENGETLLGLQSSKAVIGEKKTAYHGKDYLNVMFDTMSAAIFSNKIISIRKPLKGEDFTQTPFVKTAITFDAAPGANKTTKYYATIRVYRNESRLGFKEKKVQVFPGKWNPIVLDLSNWKYKNDINGSVEIRFTATGAGTKSWYGNLGVDWIVRSANSETYMSAEGIHNGQIDKSEVMLGGFEVK